MNNAVIQVPHMCICNNNNYVTTAVQNTGVELSNSAAGMYMHMFVYYLAMYANGYLLSFSPCLAMLNNGGHSSSSGKKIMHHYTQCYKTWNITFLSMHIYSYQSTW